MMSPALDDNGFKLTESAAIMAYICDKYHNASKFYPKDLEVRAKINEYLHHHPSRVRNITRKVFHPAMLTVMDQFDWTDDFQAKSEAVVQKEGNYFADTFLSHSTNNYIATDDSPSIADFLAYCELAQAPQMLDIEYENPAVSDFLDRVSSSLDHHDDVHRTLFKLKALFQAKI